MSIGRHNYISQSSLRFPIAASADKNRRRTIALVIAAHNEEMFLQRTITSALLAGQLARDIYVVDDGSKDTTRKIALEFLPATNVFSEWQSGKSRALANVVTAKGLTRRYDWIHFADADCIFGEGYFHTFRKALRPEYAAATGYIKSLPGTKTSEYRIYEYTWGMEIVRRFQTAIDLILVVPGASSCFRSDILDAIEFESGTITEDFDWTIQLIRNNMGSIQFIPEAKVFTQDPKNLKDYYKQITRWYRGGLQVARLRGLGLRGHKEDLYYLYQIVQVIVSVTAMFVLGPLAFAMTGSAAYIAYFFLFDFIPFLLSVVFSGGIARRIDIISNLPRFYLLRWLNALVFMRELISVGILGRHTKNVRTSWSTDGRRYAIGGTI